MPRQLGECGFKHVDRAGRLPKWAFGRGEMARTVPVRENRPWNEPDDWGQRLQDRIHRHEMSAKAVASPGPRHWQNTRVMWPVVVTDHELLHQRVPEGISR